MRPQRIVIVGNSGSGKSHLSKSISAITGLPVIHLDNLFWRPGWVKTPKSEWIETQERLVSADQWILDGNYGSTLELRFTGADLVIYLDVHPLTCSYGFLTRHGKKRDDLPPYLEESFNAGVFSHLGTIWRFDQKDRPLILALHDKYPNQPFLRLRGRRAARRYLDGLRSSYGLQPHEQRSKTGG